MANSNKSKQGPGILTLLAMVLGLILGNMVVLGVVYTLLQAYGVFPTPTPTPRGWKPSATPLPIALDTTPTKTKYKPGIGPTRMRPTSVSTRVMRTALPASFSPQFTPFSTPTIHSQQSSGNQQLTPLPKPTQTTISPPYPEKAQVSGVRGHKQTLPLSCEARSAVDWAAYFGVGIAELDFQKGIPISDNPDEGFVGDVNGTWGQIPPNSYGVHAEPIAALLKANNLSAQARHGMNWDDLRKEIASGRPVIVWVKGNMEMGEATLYTSSSGRQTYVTPYEHTMIVTGYDMTPPVSVTVLNGGSEEHYPLANFISSWAILGNMAVTY